MGKLVRDHIPRIIRANGQEPLVRTLDADDEYRRALLDKLLEEAHEASIAEPSDLLEELADVLEVMLALVSDLDLDWDTLEHLTTTKRAERGGFVQRIWLDDVR